MPKRATHTFESEKDGLKDEVLPVRYCMCCGESVLILGPETQLTDMPRRRTDGALVLEKGVITFKLQSQDKGTRVLKRAGGYERQYRFGCWNCGVMLGYRSEASEDARFTYMLADATGEQADLYLAKYQVPPCIQPTGDRSVRIAIDVLVGQPKRALTRVADSEVGVSVCAAAKEGLANAELLEYMAKLLGVVKAHLQLSRGWSMHSKFLIVSGLRAVDVFKKLKAAVDTDASAIGGVATIDNPGADAADAARGGAAGAPFVTAGMASGVARRNWEEGEELDDLAEAPSKSQQQFIK